MKKLVFFLCLIAPMCCVAQEHLSKQGKDFQDSLLAELPRSAADTNGVKLLAELSFAYRLSDAAEAARYGQQALDLSRRLGWRKGEALALNNLGNAAHHRGLYPAALDFYFRSLTIFESLKERAYIAKVENNIGTVYLNQGENAKSLSYFFKSLSLSKDVGSATSELTAMANIGNVYLIRGIHDSALFYLQKALAVAERLQDRKGIINQLTNIGTVYAEQGASDTALHWYFKALPLAREEGDLRVTAAAEGNIGETYLDLARSPNTPQSQRAANLGEAITYLQRGIALGREVQYNEAVLDFLQTLSEAQALRGDYRAALESYQQYTGLKDTTFNLQNNALIADLETRRAVELKDKDIQIAQLAVAKKRNERGFFIAGIAALLVVLGLLFRHSKKQGHTNALLSKEKDRSDALLRNVLPAEIAEELKETGTAHAKQYRDVSVIFTDFVDFTTTASRLTPNEVLQELNECFTAFDAIIERCGLEKIKTIGDAYMAVSGLPNPAPQHACHAVSAGLEILRFIQERRAKQTALEIRIGINSGPVVAGIVGVKKFAYDIWGDTVNTAARMEQHGVVGAINISQTTYDLVKNDFACTYRGMVAAKHKGEVEMYLVQIS